MEDLPLLVRHFVDKLARQYSKEVQGLTQRAQILVAAHSWRGNVRELENVIGHGCMMAMGVMIDVADLPESLQSPSATTKLPAAEIPRHMAEPVSTQNGTSPLSLEEHEKQLLTQALTEASGNQSK